MRGVAMSGIAVNLRSDLRRLSDAELAQRLQEAWHTYERAEKRPKWSTISLSARGPIRHPAAYRLVAALSNTGGSMVEVLVSILLMGKKTERFLRSDRASDIHLSLCEVKDITEEIERRVNVRKQGGA
jgi:hypothetical protein